METTAEEPTCETCGRTHRCGSGYMTHEVYAASRARRAATMMARHGSTSGFKGRTLSAEARAKISAANKGRTARTLQEKADAIKARCTVEGPFGCLVFPTERTRAQKEYRLVWCADTGNPPPAKPMSLDHLCANGRCCNSAHIDLCHETENKRRGSTPHFHLRPSSYKG